MLSLLVYNCDFEASNKQPFDSQGKQLNGQIDKVFILLCMANGKLCICVHLHAGEREGEFKHKVKYRCILG